MKRWFAKIEFRRTVKKLRNTRYKHLLIEIDKIKARRILEVGIYNGRNSERMIRAAKMHYAPEKVEFFGFDLFEMITTDVAQKEKTADKIPPTMEQVRHQLAGTGANIHLYMGYSQDTIPDFVRSEQGRVPIDFIFIDGGHSVETVMMDWKNLQPLIGKDTVVIMDDYYGEGVAEGCRSLIKSLDLNEFNVSILEPAQVFEKADGPLSINFVRVRRV